MQMSTAQRGILTQGEFSAVVAAKLSGKVAMVYLAILLHADHDGICWPGRKLLATLTEVHPDHVSNAIATLVCRGLIDKIMIAGKRGYRLIHHAVPETTESGSRKLPNSVAQRTVHGTSSLSLCATQKSEPDLAAMATPPPDSIPALWLEEARQERPDLPPAAIVASGRKFIDHHRARGTRLADWRPAWRNWVRRERTNESSARARQAATGVSAQPIGTAPAVSRYHQTQPNQGADEHMRRAELRSLQDLRKQQESMGIDPSTGTAAAQGAALVERDPASQGAALVERQASQGAALVVEASPASQGAALVVEASPAAQGAALVVEASPAAQGAALEEQQASQGAVAHVEALAALVERQAAQGAVAHVEALARNLAGAMRIPSPRIAPPRVSREVKPSPRGATMSRDERIKIAAERFGIPPERMTGQFKQSPA